MMRADGTAPARSWWTRAPGCARARETNMRISQAATLAIGAAMLASLSGCIADTGEEGEGEGEVVGLGEDGSLEVGTAEQAFSSIYAWGYTVGGTYVADLKPVTTHTPFLMQLTGNIQGSAGVILYASAPNMWKAEIQSAADHWIGIGLGAVGSVNGRTQPQSYINYDPDNTNDAVPLGSTSSDGLVRCFLTGILNSSAGYTQWGSTNDKVEIFAHNGTWYLGGQGRVTAHARCLRVSERLSGTTKTVSYPASDTTVELGFDEPGKHCWLTAIGGSFRSDNTSRGVRVFYDGGSLKWKMTVTANKYGRVECNK
jgi:hypothetical protein